MSSAAFEVAIQAIKQQQTYAIDATEIGVYVLVNPLKKKHVKVISYAMPSEYFKSIAF